MTENKPFMKEAEKNSSMVEMVISFFINGIDIPIISKFLNMPKEEIKQILEDNKLLDQEKLFIKEINNNFGQEGIEYLIYVNEYISKKEQNLHIMKEMSRNSIEVDTIAKILDIPKAYVICKLYDSGFLVRRPSTLEIGFNIGFEQSVIIRELAMLVKLYKLGADIPTIAKCFRKKEEEIRNILH